MKCLKLLIVFIAFSAISASGTVLKLKDNLVQPFSTKKYPIEKFINEYANSSNIMVYYNKGLKGSVTLTINAPISIDQLTQYFLKALSDNKLTFVKEGGGLRIFKIRDIRYTPTKIYKTEAVPDTESYVSVIHKMKYPLSKSVVRNLRPFMSRYGRIVTYNDAKTILLHDKGRNAKRLINIIEGEDTKAAFDKMIDKKREKQKNEKKKNKEIKKLEEKIQTLELRNKFLEKKYLDVAKGDKK